MLLVARIDALGRITELEIDALPQPGRLRQERPAHVARHAGIDCQFKDYDRTGPQARSNQRTGLGEQHQIGTALGIDRRWDRDDQETRLGQRVGIVGQPKRGLA